MKRKHKLHYIRKKDKTYIIEYEDFLSSWVVYRKDENLYFSIYHDKLLKNCKKWLKIN